MQIRQYDKRRDFNCIKEWIGGERAHALWCANRFPYPIAAGSFHAFLDDLKQEWAADAFVAVDKNDNAIGFFCYSLLPESSAGFLSFAILDPKLRRKGYGQEMVRLALQYAFEMTGAQTVDLNVFAENPEAIRCYEKIGFVIKNTERNAFRYQDEIWNRYHMAAVRP